MTNDIIRKPFPLLDLSYRGFIAIAVTVGGGFAWNANFELGRIGQQVVDHITNHPNIGLSARIDEHEEDIDALEDRFIDLLQVCLLNNNNNNIFREPEE